jgi:murein DD-endopeptidase MepM/ murein hydrolase activator NlpD
LLRNPAVLLTSLLACAAACARPDPPPRRGPGHADVRLVAEIETIESTVPRNATLDGLLRANRLNGDLVVDAVNAARNVFDPRHLRADQPYRLVRSLDGLLREYEYQIDADAFLSIVNRDRSRPEALDAKVMKYEKETEVVGIDARIDRDHSSLISAIDDTGENIQLALSLADIFSGQVDFRSELQPGDRFRVLFEKSSREGEFCGYGAILGASIDVSGRRLQAFRWDDPATGKAAYYDENGRSLKRFFLKSPLKFEPDPRVTSAFSLHRLHPIDQVYKAHLGVDYAAPMGSSVVAIASGVVLSAGFSGAGGNMVHLKHADGFETYYLHLSAFGVGVHAGTHVAQGQVIGRVGMTGSATGPHLDFRLKKNGAFLNPVSVHSKQAPGEPIPNARLASFRTSRDKVLVQLTTTLLADAQRQKPDAVPAK